MKRLMVEASNRLLVDGAAGAGAGAGSGGAGAGAAAASAFGDPPAAAGAGAGAGAGAPAAAAAAVAAAGAAGAGAAGAGAGTGAGAGAGAKAGAGAAVEYKLDLPAEAHPDANKGLIDQTKALAKELGLSPEQATKFFGSLAFVPKQYALDIPGVPKDDPVLQQLHPVFRELGLANEDAQTLGTAYVKIERAVFEQRRVEGLAAIQADPEVGGAHYADSQKLVQRAIAGLKDPELQPALVAAGLDNNLTIFRTLVRVGRMFGEDTSAGARGTAPQKLTEKQRLKARYDDMPHPD